MEHEQIIRTPWVHAGEYNWVPLGLVMFEDIETDIYLNEVVTFRLDLNEQSPKYKSKIIYAKNPNKTK